jgi:3-methyl-2-oxobutanoate hydroxymethyltransferase
MTEPAAPKTKRAIPSFRESKRRGEKLTMITVYDYPMARLVDQSPAELILVGDSLGDDIRKLYPF